MRYKNESIEMGEIVSERDNIDEKTKPQCASVLWHYDTYLYTYMKAPTFYHVGSGVPI